MKPRPSSMRRGIGALGAAGIALLAAGLVPLTAAPAPASAAPGTPAHAVQDLAYCSNNSLDRGIGVSSPAVALPFPIGYFGQTHNELYVNSVGSVSFGSPVTEPGYDDGVGISEWHSEQIAPFYSLLDTSIAGSEAITYGASPDGSTFCANWVGVAAGDRYDAMGIPAGTNSFQLLIRDRSALPGGTVGDVDVTFNYDSVQSAGAHDGFFRGFAGMISHDEPNAIWRTALPGSGVLIPAPENAGLPQEISVLTDGQEWALTAGSLNSPGTLGRYTFNLRAGQLPTPSGSLSGTVRDDRGRPMPGAIVQASPSRYNGSYNMVTTDAQGRYLLPNLEGSQLVIASPAPNTSYLWPKSVQVSILPAEQKTADIQLPRPNRVPPEGTTLTKLDGTLVDSPKWREATIMTVTACSSGSVNFGIYAPNGRRVWSDNMVPDTQNRGLYRATIPATIDLESYGPVELRITKLCPGELGVTTTTDLYIDPSGTIVDTADKPVADATVTLLRADSPEGPFIAVEEGSALMSPNNRKNPDVTGTDGAFAWDVMAGYYVVEASAESCHAPGSTEATVRTDVLPVPPEQLDLKLVLECAEPGEVIIDPAPETTLALELGSDSVLPGAELALTGSGFAAGEEIAIWLHSTPVVLATVTADPAGAVATTVTIPADAAAGAHRVELRGVTSGSVFAALTVADPAGSNPAGALPEAAKPAPGLASTGSDMLPAAALALLLLAAGTVFTVRRRGARA
ncbi:carboxypeptidase-like regulatory domain-containing protein [Mycetocola spongiae]|uniref:carboxypeptidase-like regulatory domain-containing protein n=1 Tax=Mycetocola spongiae TaxID=2859226 RepID=UPI001CF2CC52|nr:carboxypeptidase-like regulatory domain-containing protein [Mycetocola spongiae]UCR88364.1 carboxypeptidase-like regulatory domain-containing protein [Mycetocola spongiae]